MGREAYYQVDGGLSQSHSGAAVGFLGLMAHMQYSVVTVVDLQTDSGIPGETAQAVPSIPSIPPVHGVSAFAGLVAIVDPVKPHD
jgi:hypothetical protein